MQSQARSACATVPLNLGKTGLGRWYRSFESRALAPPEAQLIILKRYRTMGSDAHTKNPSAP